MVSVPTFFNGLVEFKNLGYLSFYEKTENISIYNLEFYEAEIKGHYIMDYDSSVWIYDRIKYENFAQIFVVRSGGWYGPENGGGRWNTIKRTYGEISFIGIRNYNKVASTDNNGDTLKILKKPFSNKMVIDIKSSDAQVYYFSCREIKFFPSNRILLLDRKTEKFIDKTEILDPDGLGLLENFL